MFEYVLYGFAALGVMLVLYVILYVIAYLADENGYWQNEFTCSLLGHKWRKGKCVQDDAPNFFAIFWPAKYEYKCDRCKSEVIAGRGLDV